MYVFGSNIYLVYTTAVCESVCVCAIVPVLALLCVSPPTNRTTHIPSLAVSAATRPRVLATARDLSYPILSYPILSSCMGVTSPHSCGSISCLLDRDRALPELAAAKELLLNL